MSGIFSKIGRFFVRVKDFVVHWATKAVNAVKAVARKVFRRDGVPSDGTGAARPRYISGVKGFIGAVALAIPAVWRGIGRVFSWIGDKVAGFAAHAYMKAEEVKEQKNNGLAVGFLRGLGWLAFKVAWPFLKVGDGLQAEPGARAASNAWAGAMLGSTIAAAAGWATLAWPIWLGLSAVAGIGWGLFSNRKAKKAVEAAKAEAEAKGEVYEPETEDSNPVAEGSLLTVSTFSPKDGRIGFTFDGQDYALSRVYTVPDTRHFKGRKVFTMSTHTPQVLTDKWKWYQGLLQTPDGFVWGVDLSPRGRNEQLKRINAFMHRLVAENEARMATVSPEA